LRGRDKIFKKLGVKAALVTMCLLSNARRLEVEDSEYFSEYELFVRVKLVQVEHSQAGARMLQAQALVNQSPLKIC